MSETDRKLTPAATLREAARLMRARAAVTIRTLPDGEQSAWYIPEAFTSRQFADVDDATHIASWSPDVALVVADWLDRIAWTWEIDPELQHRVGGGEALAVACAYLNGASE